MRSVTTLGLGILIAAAAPGLRAQANPATADGVKYTLADAGQLALQATQPPAKPAAQAPAKPAPTTAAKPAPQPAKPAGTSAPQAAKPAGKPAAKPAAGKPAAKPAAKPAVKPAAKPAVKAVEKPSTPGAPPAAESEVKQARRDPFESLVSRQQANANAISHLPPGKAGLQVSTLRLDGIVKAPNGMIAVVSNPQLRTYFLREGDHLYDGSVDKISMDGVSFHEEGKDAFGKPVERQVNKRIYSTSSGETQ
jgi:Tfp pilus assembly protein PilP